MGVAQIREELHELINHADDQVLDLIYDMLQTDISARLTKSQQDDLNMRIARHKKGESKSISWEEAKARIVNRK
jgi:putative addiction module component (TIGR02574 family)